MDWLAAASYDTAVGLSFFTLQVTHRIDANIDIERNHVVTTLTLSNPCINVQILSFFVRLSFPQRWRRFHSHRR